MQQIFETYRDIFAGGRLYFLASASTSFYTFIRHKGIENSCILCPSNICYSIPYTILATSNRPLFYDVKKETGNASLRSIREILQKHDGIGAILLPHMFGNPIAEWDEIVRECRAHGLVVVEDCAGALGLEFDRGGHTEKADASIYSFASNKHVAMGRGGVLGCDEEIDVEGIGATIANGYIEHRYKIEMLDRLYKAVFYSDDYYNLVGHLHTFNDFMADSHVYRFEPDEDYASRLAKKLEDFDRDRAFRREMNDDIDERIDFAKSWLARYKYGEGHNPWRHNLLVSDAAKRSELIAKLLEQGLPVSIWYPPIDTIFGQPFQPDSTEFSKKIVNFDFINASKLQIDRYIETVNAL